MVSASNTPSENPQVTTTSDAGRRRQHVAEDAREGLDAWLQALGAFLVYTATWQVYSKHFTPL
jgi:hypothetical protein